MRLYLSSFRMGDHPQELRVTGADDVIVEALRRDALVYAGYSAGPCVLAPSLRGLARCDDVSEVRRLHGTEPVWDGLGVPRPCRRAAPGLAGTSRDRRPGHGRGAVPHHRRASRRAPDGQAMVVDGQRVSIV